MARKSKLLSALDAHKGRNFELERQKKLQKAAEKKKKKRKEEEEEEEEKQRSKPETEENSNRADVRKLNVCVDQTQSLGL